MVRMTALVWLALVVAACAGLYAGEARAGEDRARPSLAPNFIAAVNDGGDVGALRMLPIAASVIEERAGDTQKERLRRMKLYRTLGITAAAATVAIVGGVLAGPTYGTAAGAAVLIIYLFIP